MKTPCVFLLCLLPVLAGCASGRTLPASTAVPATAAIHAVPATLISTAGVLPASGTQSASATPSGGEWLTYTDAQAGYSVTYPRGWSVTGSAGANGERIATFMAPGGASSIVVTVLSDAGATPQPEDMPNTHCQPITISGVPGRRCLDTIAGSLTTMLSGNNRQYTITSSPHFLDQALYEAFLQSFRLAP